MGLRVAFTSCARFKPGQAQWGWAEIEAAQPDVLLLLGDQIYMDFGLWPFAAEPQRAPRRYSVAQFAQVMRAKYAAQWAEPHFAHLLAVMRARGGLMGVWDDHDFGWNNAYGLDPLAPQRVHLAEKVAVARALFHEFMDCAVQPPLLYGARDWPLARVIVLDNRSYATPLSVQPAALMGQLQMRWLAQALHHTQPYTLVCGGLTLTHSAENWSRYGDEFAQFTHAARDVPGLLYLGGDIHRNAFDPPAPGGAPCYQLTASGLNVNVLGLPFEWDRRRNWGLVELDPAGVQVSLHDKHGCTRWAIDRHTWTHRYLGCLRKTDGRKQL